MRARRLLQIAPLAILPFAIGLAAAGPQQRPTFQTAIDVVTMDVTVHQGNLAVPGLTADDFIVTDNGVVQKVEAASGDSLPVDMTIVIDASGSVEEMMDQLKKDATEAAAMLRSDDQLRILAFTAEIAQVSPMLPATSELEFTRMPRSGMTSIFDALAVALMRMRAPDRHELVVLFTDGADTTSVLGGEAVRDVARRSDAILHTFIVHPPPRPPGPGPSTAQMNAAASNNNRKFWLPFKSEPHPAVTPRDYLDQASEATGGELQDIFGEAHVPRGLKTAIDDMRTSYILRFNAQGVTRAGWHELKVKLKRPGDFTIRTRKGYFGGGG